MTIEVVSLGKSFVSGRGRRRRRVDAVHDVSFAVDAGERVAYLGPNGAGKSTTIKMLTGVLHASGGDARVLGLVPWQQRRTLTRRIGTLFGQRSQLWHELTPRQSFRMLAAIHRLGPAQERRRVGELAGLLDAGDLFDRSVRSLSLGQRMRCELAACLLHEPAILFLDEPTIGLDLLARQRFRELLVRLNVERGTTIFLTSHDVADVEAVAQRAIVMNAGTIIYDDAVATMRRELLATKLIEVTLSSPVERVAIDGVAVTRHRDGIVDLTVDTTRRSVRDVLDAVLDAWPVADISVLDPPLEMVIAEIYGRGAPVP
jgi:ABC-2 type transport system ATP-binding protein